METKKIFKRLLVDGALVALGWFASNNKEKIKPVVNKGVEKVKGVLQKTPTATSECGEKTSAGQQ